MLSPEELKSRKFSTVLAAGDLMTNRSHAVMEGSTQHIYLGYAYPGSGEADSVWMVKRVSLFEDGSMATKFAAGEARFEHAWSDHVSLTYA
ncbi:MAG: hypothetical protein HQL97_16845 [Magnetococcales bacterium]|nr:hypothetical protein [Magnetococcales bacterium]